MPAGRPTEYNEEILELSRDYLENFNATYEHAIPSVVGLCSVLNRSRSTLYRWNDDEDKTEFRDILKAIQEKQELELIDGGLTGQFNPAIAKLALGKHGYHEKVDNTLANPDGGPIEVSYTGVPPSGARSKED